MNIKMATELQKRAVQKLVERARTGQQYSVSAAMRDAGYSPKTAVVPGRLTKSKGFKEILAENGLTPDLILKALVSDIKKKPGKRIQELKLGAEILQLKEWDENNQPPYSKELILSQEQEKSLAFSILQRTKVTKEEIKENFREQFLPQ